MKNTGAKKLRFCKGDGPARIDGKKEGSEKGHSHRKGRDGGALSHVRCQGARGGGEKKSEEK